MIATRVSLCSRNPAMFGSIKGLGKAPQPSGRTPRFNARVVINGAHDAGHNASRKGKGHRVRSRSSMALEMATDHAQTPFLSLGRYRALVLDPGMQPIDIVNWQRALVLDMLAKVDVLEYYQDVSVHSVSAEFFLPAVLMAKQVGKNASKFTRVPLNRRNIMIRDNLTCQYCGKKPGKGKGNIAGLTLDHVVAQSKGGENSWTNLVTACGPCNTRKGHQSLKELRWKLLSTPKEPSPFDLTMQLAMLGMSNLSDIPEEWSNYLFGSGSDTD